MRSGRSSESSISSELSDRRPMPSHSSSSNAINRAVWENPILPSLRSESQDYVARDQYNLPSITCHGEGASLTSQGHEQDRPYDGRDTESYSYQTKGQEHQQVPLVHPHYPYGSDSLDRAPYNDPSLRAQYPLNFETAGDFGDGRHKRRRGNLPKAVTDILRQWFSQHIAHPYPSEEEKQMLMSQTGLTISQVSH